MSFWNNHSQSLQNRYYIAHNQFLEILLNGGMFCLIPFFMSLLSTVFYMKKEQDKLTRGAITGALLGFLIVMITETVYPYEPFYVFLIFVSLIGEINECRSI